MVSHDFSRQLSGYGLTTAHISIDARIILGCCKATSGRNMTFARIFRSSTGFSASGAKRWKARYIQ